MRGAREQSDSPPASDLVGSLAWNLAYERSYVRRNSLLMDLARVCRDPGRAASLASPYTLERLVDALRREPAEEAARADLVRPNFLWYRDLLLAAGPAALPAARSLLNSPPLPVALLRRPRPWLNPLARWFGRPSEPPGSRHCGAKLTALSVLETGASSADEELLAKRVRSTGEALPVRRAAALLWHRVAGERSWREAAWLTIDAGLPELPGERALWLAVFRPGLESELTRIAHAGLVNSQAAADLLRRVRQDTSASLCGPLTGRREVDEALLGGEVTDDLAAFATSEVLAALCAGLVEPGCRTRRARLQLLHVLLDAPATQRWLAVPAQLERLVDALLTVYLDVGRGYAAPENGELSLGLLLGGLQLTPTLLRRVLAALGDDCAGARELLLGRLTASLTAADGPLLGRLATNPANSAELRRLALRWWLQLDADAATPAVRAAVLRRQLDLPLAVRQRADHLDWLLSALVSTERAAREVAGELVAELGTAAVEPLSAVVIDAERTDVAEAVLGTLAPDALRGALAERESRARALSRAVAPGESPERGLSRPPGAPDG